jgi:hypothetical protein
MKFWVIWTVSNCRSEEIFSLIVVLFRVVLPSPDNGHLTRISICISVTHWIFNGENNVWNKRWGQKQKHILFLIQSHMLQAHRTK